MKKIFLLAACLVLGAATVEAQTSPKPMSKEQKKALRKARRRNGPEVYKGGIAEQRRMLADGGGSDEDKPTKKRAHKHK